MQLSDAIQQLSQLQRRQYAYQHAQVILTLDAATAAQDACRIEHVLSKESFEAIKRHVESGLSARP